MIKRLAILFGLVVASSPLVAQNTHNHMNGDCQQICDLNCQALIRQLEEIKGYGACTNYGYGMNVGTEGRCNHNPPGPLVWNMNCDSDGDCQMWGTLKCTLPSGIKSYPSYDMTCFGKEGVAAKVEILETYVQCDYPDNTGYYATCSVNGDMVVFGGW